MNRRSIKQFTSATERSSANAQSRRCKLNLQHTHPASRVPVQREVASSHGRAVVFARHLPPRMVERKLRLPLPSLTRSLALARSVPWRAVRSCNFRKKFDSCLERRLCRVSNLFSRAARVCSREFRGFSWAKGKGHENDLRPQNYSNYYRQSPSFAF